MNDGQSKENAGRIKTARDFYQSILVTGDWDGVARCLVPDFTVYEAEGLPYGGTYRGIESLKSLLGTLSGHWDNLKIELRDIAAGDSVTVGVLQFSGRAKATGRELTFPIVEMLEFKGDLISTIRPVYWDTKTLSEALVA